MRTSRRTFIKAAGSILAASRIVEIEARPSPPEEPEAAVPGRWIIDCQSHLFAAEIVALMEKRQKDPRVFTREGMRHVQMGCWLRKIPPHYLDVNVKLSAMDANGIAMTALSINDPGPEWFGSDGPAVAQLANDFVAEIVQRHPTRFFGLCVLPLQDMKASMAEIDRCFRHLDMKGILLYTNIAGKFPDEPEFRPLFARAVELNVPVLLHPAKPVTLDAVRGYEMTSTLGNMFENTIALTRLIMSGLLDEFPKLKLVCPHLGGTLPYIIGRLDHQVRVLRRGPKNLTRAPSEYLRQVWYDIVSPLPLAMRFAYDLLGEERLLYASDHPWVEPEVILKAFRSLRLPEANQSRILGQNARNLFGL